MVIYCKFFSIVVINMAAIKTKLKVTKILDVKLNLSNFLDWERKLRQVLRWNNIEYVVDHPIPSYYSKDMTPEKHYTWANHVSLVMDLILGSIPNDWSARFVAYEPWALLRHLSDICRGRFQHSGQHVDQNVFELVNSFEDLKLNAPLGCCFDVERQKARERVIDLEMTERTPIRTHTKKMVGLLNRVELLGDPFPDSAAAGILLNSLHPGYKKFKLLYFPRKGRILLVN